MVYYYHSQKKIWVVCHDLKTPNQQRFLFIPNMISKHLVILTNLLSSFTSPDLSRTMTYTLRVDGLCSKKQPPGRELETIFFWGGDSLKVCQTFIGVGCWIVSQDPSWLLLDYYATNRLYIFHVLHLQFKNLCLYTLIINPSNQLQGNNHHQDKSKPLKTSRTLQAPEFFPLKTSLHASLHGSKNQSLQQRIGPGAGEDSFKKTQNSQVQSSSQIPKVGGQVNIPIPWRVGEDPKCFIVM